MTENHGVPGSSPGPATSFYGDLQVKQDMQKGANSSSERFDSSLIVGALGVGSSCLSPRNYCVVAVSN